MPLPPKTDLLDPRTESEAAANPVPGAVNIPLGQLESRSHELPNKGEKLRVVGPTELAQAAIAWLANGGRDAEHAWEGKGEPGPYRLWSATEFLDRVPSQPGLALDLGCGSGRDVVALGAKGWSVIGLDRLPDALTRGRDLAARYLPEAQRNTYWVEGNAESQLPFQTGVFDLIIIFRFLPRIVLPLLPDLLKPGGSIMLETFTVAHHERHGKPQTRERVLGPTEALTLFPGLQVRHHSYAWREGGIHTVRLLAAR